MAAYISVPRDLSRVKTKILFGLTQKTAYLFFDGGNDRSAVIFYAQRGGNTSLAMMSMIIIMMPFFLLAMYEKDGQPMEVLVRHYVESRFIRPKERPYQTNNYYAFLMRLHQLCREGNIDRKDKKSVSGK